MKRIMSVLICLVIVLSTVACGSSNTDNANKGEKLVVWTLAEDLKFFADKYMEENPGKEVEVVVIPPKDYPTKLTSTLKGKSATPDIIVGEVQMLPNFFEAGFFEDLTKEPYNATEYESQYVGYVYEAGKSKDGVLRALSYQMTPGAVYYRRDLAKEVFGNDDPAFISEKLSSFDNIVEAGRELNEAGYKIFTETTALNYFMYTEEKQPWVVDGKLMMNQDRLNILETSKTLYDESLIAYAPMWSNSWHAAISGEIPLASADGTNSSDTTQVFSYVLPTWGLGSVIKPNSGDTFGNWGIASGPGAYFWGGTFVGISSYSKNKDMAWDFLKYVTVDESTVEWWAEEKGDIVSVKPVIEKVKATVDTSLTAGQNQYEYFLPEAEKIDFSLITKYDENINQYFIQAMETYQQGSTLEEALSQFYKNVKSVFPEIEVPQN